MQVPIGVSGVQAVPNTLHSQGLMTPFSTSPHWQAFGSATRTPGTSKRSSASHGANSALSLSALWEMNPRPRHSKCGRSSNTSFKMASALGFPASLTQRVYWFSTQHRPSLICTSSIAIACRMSRGSKPAVTTGLPYTSGTKRYGRWPTTVDT